MILCSSGSSPATCCLNKHFHLLIFSALLPPLTLPVPAPSLHARKISTRDLHHTPRAMAFWHQKIQAYAVRNSMMALPASLPQVRIVSRLGLLCYSTTTVHTFIHIFLPNDGTHQQMGLKATIWNHHPSAFRVEPTPSQKDHYLLQGYLQGRTSAQMAALSPLSMSLYLEKWLTCTRGLKFLKLQKKWRF